MKRHSQPSSDKKRLIRIVWLVATVLVIGFLAPRFVAFLGMIALYPVQATQQWFNDTTLAVPALWREKTQLQDQVTKLENELSHQSSDSVSEQRLKEENHQLRSLLRATTTDRIAAVVIARPDQLPFDLLQIDQGSSAGVEVGAPVYFNDEEVLGIVSETYSGSALVTLFTTPGFVSTAYLGEADVLVQVEGLGGGVARVLVPQGIPLRNNSLVYLPSIQPGVLGRIVAIENEATQPQQFGYIVSSVPMQQIRYVSVGQVTDIRTEKVDVERYLLEIKDSMALPDISIATATTTTATSTATTSATSTATTTEAEIAL